ncbi:MAG: metallophosphoesterase [Oscillibacter sp.]
MQLLILSDSHGNLDNMVRAVERTSPRMIFHLGDCWGDARRLHAAFPAVELVQVPGNCDFRPAEPVERLVMVEDKRILLCHGHTYGVKASLLTVGYAAEEQHADLLLFGHTHQPLQLWSGKTLLVNPGSIGDFHAPSYAVVRIAKGELTADLFRLE